jgi:hypothetical protein
MLNLTANNLAGGFDVLKVVLFVLFGLFFLNYTGQNRRAIRVVAGRQKRRNQLAPWSIRVSWNRGRFYRKGVNIMRTLVQKLRALRLAKALLPAAVIAVLLALASPAVAGTDSPSTTGKQDANAISFTELTDENFQKEMDPSGKEPFLMETCVSEACALEQDDLNLVAKAFAGKVRVIRLNSTLHPKLYATFLFAMAATSGQPNLPFVVAQTSGRWVMHTVLAPNTAPFASTFGLATGDTMANFLVGVLAQASTHKPDGVGTKADRRNEI